MRILLVLIGQLLIYQDTANALNYISGQMWNEQPARPAEKLLSHSAEPPPPSLLKLSTIRLSALERRSLKTSEKDGSINVSFHRVSAGGLPERRSWRLAEPKRQWWEDSAEIRDNPQDISTAFERAGHVWDSAQKSNIPLNEADQLFNVSAEQKPPVDDGLIKRFGKKFYNSAVANVVQAVATKSEAGQIKTDIYTLSGLSEDFRQRAETNQGVTLRELEHYAKPKELS